MKQKLGTLKIDKELFREVMTAIDTQRKHDRKCTDAFQVILPNDFVSGYENGVVISMLLSLLKLSFKDNTKDSWIDYFQYDMDFGRDYKVGCASYKDGTNIPLATIDDLWNLLNE